MFLPPPYNKGFTLAETLITLVIIGVIAAITIPSLIAKYQEEQLKTQLKKSYSTLSNALNATVREFGYLPNCYLTSNTNEISDCAIFVAALLNKLNVIKHCVNKSMDNGCIPTYTEYGTGGENGNSNCTYLFSAQHLNNQVQSWVLADGSTLFQENGSVSYYSPIFYFDINGFKGPNTPGKDVFGIVFYKPERINALKIVGHYCIPGQTIDNALKNAYK